MLKNIRKNNVGLVLLALCAFLFVGYGTYSYLSTKNENAISITTGDVGIQLVEDFPSEGGDEGETTNDKTFWGVVTGSKDSVVRASIIPSVEYYNENTKKWEKIGAINITEGVKNDRNFNYTVSEETQKTWKKGADGYWYYQNILKGNKNSIVDDKIWHDNDYTTSKFEIHNVYANITQEDLPENAKNAKVRLNMVVSIENSQATHKAFISNWPGCDESVIPHYN